MNHLRCVMISVFTYIVECSISRGQSMVGSSKILWFISGVNIMCSSQVRIQDFKLGGGALEKIAPSGGRREFFWGISCEKSRFYAKKSYFFQF